MEQKKQFVEPQLVEFGKVEELTLSSRIQGPFDQGYYQSSGTLISGHS